MALPWKHKPSAPADKPPYEPVASFLHLLIVEGLAAEAWDMHRRREAASSDGLGLVP